MVSARLLKNVFLAFLLVSYRSVTANEDPLNDHVKEVDSLHVLKASFSDGFLEVNWTGSPCNASQPWYGVRCSNRRVAGILLENMGLKGEVSTAESLFLPELSVLSLKNNSIRGTIMDFSSSQKLKRIDLSFNRFSGQISPSLLGLNLLESLQLQDNNLVGWIPEFNQSCLKAFDVSNNNLSGMIPRTQTLQSFGSASYSGNAGLCGPPSPTACAINSVVKDTSGSQNNSTPPPASSSSHSFITISVIFNLILLVALVSLFILYCSKVQNAKKVKEGGAVKVEKNREGGLRIMEAGLKREAAQEGGNLLLMEDGLRFQIRDLLGASAEGLGTGILGNTYVANLNGGPSIVVKRLRDLKPFTSREFVEQLRLLADLRHPNLLPLLGCFYSVDKKLLLNKYAEKGNLFNRIHGEKEGKRIPFRWSARLKVARAVARGLEYLHLNTKIQSMVPHGNLKSSNVLFDENDTVLVSDYGLASLVALPIASQQMVSFKAPEYRSSRRVTKKSDVWSYGCLLLELLTAKIPSTTAPPGINGVNLYSWIHRAVREEWTAEVFDPEISRQRNAHPGMLRLLKIALRCSDESPQKRPEMTDVVRELEQINVPESEEFDDLSLDHSVSDDSLAHSATAVSGDEI